MRNAWVQVALAALGLVIVALAVLDSRSRGGQDALVASSVSTPLGKSVVIEVPRNGANPVPSACEVTVSHPGYCLHRASLDMDRVYVEGRDAEGREKLGVVHSVRLLRYAARLTGRTVEAERAALVELSALRPSEPLEIVDITDTSSGTYTLRVPSAGEWLVVALRAGAHPTYAIVDVLRSAEAGERWPNQVAMRGGR